MAIPRSNAYCSVVNKKPILEQLAEDAGSLATSTKEAVENKLHEVAEQTTSTLQQGEKICGQIRDKVSEGAEAANRTAHKRPYSLLAMGFLTGVFLALLLCKSAKACRQPNEVRKTER